MPDPSKELQGWKEIAAHLGRSMRAVQRWEVHYGMPVRRVGGTVFADRDELEAWKRSPRGQSAARALRATDEDEASASDPGPLPAAQGAPASHTTPSPVPPVSPAGTTPGTAPAPSTPTGVRHWLAGRRLRVTAAGALGALAVVGAVLLSRDDPSAGWLRRGATPPPAADWDRAGLDTGPWPAAHHDARQSAQGHTLGPADPAPPRLLLDPGGTLTSVEEMIATSHGVVVTGTCDGRVFAVRRDGSLAWVQSLDREHNDEAATGFAVGAQSQGLIVATGECPHGTFANVRTQLHVWRMSDGASIFRVRTGAMTIPPAVALTTTILQVDQYDTLRAVDAMGVVNWTLDLPGFTATPPVQDVAGRLFIATDGSLYGHRSVWGVSPQGKPLWNAVEGLFARMGLGVDGHLYAIDINRDISGRPMGPHRLVSMTTEGELRWTIEFPGWQKHASRDTLALGPSGPVVRSSAAIEALTSGGDRRWRVELDARLPTAQGFILDRDENAYVSAGDEVISLDRDGHERWRVAVPQAGRIVLAGDGMLAVTSANRRVFLIHDRNVVPKRDEGAGAI